VSNFVPWIRLAPLPREVMEALQSRLWRAFELRSETLFPLTLHLDTSKYLLCPWPRFQRLHAISDQPKEMPEATLEASGLREIGSLLSFPPFSGRLTFLHETSILFYGSLRPYDVIIGYRSGNLIPPSPAHARFLKGFRISKGAGILCGFSGRRRFRGWNQRPPLAIHPACDAPAEPWRHSASARRHLL